MGKDAIIGLIEISLQFWNEKLGEVFDLLTTSPADFRGGTIWDIMMEINGALQAFGYALIVVFFLYSFVNSTLNISEVKRPEYVFKLFLRFAVSKSVVTYGLEFMLLIFEVVQGIIASIFTASGVGAEEMLLPQSIIDAVEATSFLDRLPLLAVSFVGGIIILFLSFKLLLTAYGRFFKLFMFVAIAPIMLASFSGEHSQRMGVSFLKSFGVVCLEGAVIVLSCVIFSAFALTPPDLLPDASAATQVWAYMAELILNMLILTGTVTVADNVARQMVGH